MWTSWAWFVAAVYNLHNYYRHAPAAELPACREPQRLREELFDLLEGEEDNRPRPRKRRTHARPREKAGPAPGPRSLPEPYWAADFQ